MNRRDFLRRVLSGAAGLAIGADLDVERLLWVPKPIITVPAMPVECGVPIEWITTECLRMFKNQMIVAGAFDRTIGDVGDTIRVRTPWRVAA